MNNTNRGKKKKRITHTAINEGIERINKALAINFHSKADFAKFSLVSRCTINKFFAQKPIQSDCFQQICKELKLSDWREIAGIQEIEKLKVKEVDRSTNPNLNASLDAEETSESNNKWSLVKEIVSKPVKDRKLRDADLSGVNLINANLSGADLNDADLSGANLSNVNLSGADLIDADLIGAYLILTDLSGADLIGAELIGADLSRANLSDANLSDANLSDADLIGAYLINADLSGANLSGANLINADLSRADLSDANLSDANLYSTKINQKTKLDEKWRKVWKIVNRTARGQDLSRVDLSNANLIGADFKNAKLVQANLTNSQLNKANLMRANLIGADLSNAQLLKADLTGADLRGAKVENARFGYNRGISETMKRDLEARKAIFEDSPSDRSGVLTSV